MLVSFLMTLASILSLFIINLQNKTYFEQRQLLIKAPEPLLFLPNEPFYIKNRINLIFNNQLANNNNNNQELVLVEKVQEPTDTDIVFILSGPILLVMIIIMLYIPAFLEKREVNRNQMWNHIDNQDLEIILERGRGY
jgi:hypothetical protein